VLPADDGTMWTDDDGKPAPATSAQSYVGEHGVMTVVVIVALIDAAAGSPKPDGQYNLCEPKAGAYSIPSNTRNFNAASADTAWASISILALSPSPCCSNKK
jgi:hypothetical protein